MPGKTHTIENTGTARLDLEVCARKDNKHGHAPGQRRYLKLGSKLDAGIVGAIQPRQEVTAEEMTFLRTQAGFKALVDTGTLRGA